MNIETQVKDLIAESVILDASAILGSHSLQGDLGFDDLEVVELAMDLEEEFEIGITDEEVEAMVTVQDTIDLVVRKTK